MNEAALALGGLGVIAVLSPQGRAAVGSPIAPYVTDAHRAAMAVLESPLLGVKAGPDTRTQALLRLNEVLRLADSHGPVVMVGRIQLAQLNGSECAKVLDRFLEATAAGIAQGGYRVSALSDAQLSARFAVMKSGPRTQVEVFNALADGELAGTPIPVPLNDFGRAVLAAGVERKRCRLLGSFPITMPAFNRIAAGLAGEMDGAGYLPSGKPPPEPTIAGGIAYAADKTGRFVADVAGDAVGGIATHLLSMPIVWAVGLGLVAWKVLK